MRSSTPIRRMAGFSRVTAWIETESVLPILRLQLSQ
jgi:hypothetical protein